MNPIFENALWSAGGAFVALLASYFTLGKAISNDLHFVKGQLLMILQHLALVQKVKDTQIEHGKDLVKLKADLNFAHDKIRDLIRRPSNGDAGHI